MISRGSSSDPEEGGRRAENLIRSLEEERLISLYIEPSSRCNLSCRFCDLHAGETGGLAKPKQDMPMAMFEAILAELSSLPFAFHFASLHLHGEPLLNRNLATMASMMSASAVAESLALTTNGLLLTAKRFEELVEAGVDTIVVSLDTVSPDKYAAFKGVDGLAAALRNVDACVDRVRSGEVDAQLIVKCTESRGLHGLDANDMQEVIDRFADVARDSRNVHVQIFHEFSWYNPARDFEAHDLSPCELPFYQLCFHSDGTISPCCMDVSQSLSLGRIESGGPGLDDLLRGKRLRAIRAEQFGPSGNRLLACQRCGHRTFVPLERYRERILSLLYGPVKKP